MSDVKAWRTDLWGIVSVIKAKTRAQARAVTIRAAREAGYNATFTTPIRVRRAPALDAIEFEPMRCWSVPSISRLTPAAPGEGDDR